MAEWRRSGLQNRFTWVQFPPAPHFLMKRILTGIKPTGSLHIGNYAGFLKTLIDFQEKDYEIFLMIADLHSLTDPTNVKDLKNIKKELVAEIISLGINPQKTTIFYQSQIPYHPFFCWLFSCVVSLGDLYRMHHFKELTQNLRLKKQIINAGALYYPVLQAADILIYNPDLVPVGEDQKQHVELARQIARNFNKIFGKTFKIPKEYIIEEVARIKSLTQPFKKMSKSDPEGCLFIFDSEKNIKEKIKKAVTDSGKEIFFNPAIKPGISNLILIYKLLTGKNIKEIEEEFQDKNYSFFKEKLAQTFLDYFSPARKIKEKIKKEIEIYLEEGKKRALKIAEEMYQKILKKI